MFTFMIIKSAGAQGYDCKNAALVGSIPAQENVLLFINILFFYSGTKAKARC